MCGGHHLLGWILLFRWCCDVLPFSGAAEPVKPRATRRVETNSKSTLQIFRSDATVRFAGSRKGFVGGGSRATQVLQRKLLRETELCGGLLGASAETSHSGCQWRKTPMRPPPPCHR